jgi:acetylornithine deacetylase/succinyl-diaminopimelate desuccinylase-like protein
MRGAFIPPTIRLMPISSDEIEQLIARQRPAFVFDYKRVLEVPSISAIPAHKQNIMESTVIAADLLRAAGAEVTVFETYGNPVVFAHFENKAGAPTVAVYNHLDVQPATKGRDGWLRDPFAFAEENGRFYSRGASDDKGPAMTAFWAAKIARALGVATNIEFIWEMEEEIGSPNFTEFLDKAKPVIIANSIVVSDTQWLSADRPVVSRGLRGLLGVLLRLRTAQKDAHSGAVGGAARNPITELCEIVASCINARTGEIKVPGIDRTWSPPTQEQLDDFLASGFSVASFKAAHGLEKMRTEDPREVTARIWATPTFEVHGITGGYQDAGIKTIVPPFAEAKVSFRLVPGQDPEEVFALFERHVRSLNPDCEIVKEASLAPYAADTSLPQVKAAAQAIEFAFGIGPVFTMEGGSIGAVVTMQQKLGVPIAFMGLSLPEDGYHGPDESFAWRQIEGGVKAFVKYFELLAS